MKIPRDLKPGDAIVDDSGTRCVVVQYPHLSGHAGGSPYYSDGAIFTKRSEHDHCYFNPDGRAHGSSLFAIRIERIASKPKRAKVDRDAAYLLRLSKCLSIMPNDPKRLRAIARRLEGGRK